ncbi:MAG TPA: hypothetical protein PLV68_09895 [Ilumatobacteraceae bacterium]|nr:hypothetical protein [Ilumatobacteraceae bacterium]
MSRVDRILDLLDNATQTSGEHGYPTGVPDACWRCHGAPGDGPSGVCDECRTVLLVELPPEDGPGAAGCGVFGGRVMFMVIDEVARADWLSANPVIPRRVVLGVDPAAYIDIDEAREALAILERQALDRQALELAGAIASTLVEPSVHARGRTGQRRREVAQRPCRHGNPRNTCRDCSTGRRR